MTTTALHPLRTLGNSDLHLTPIGFGALNFRVNDDEYSRINAFLSSNPV